jgi:hypothetical protein
MGRIHAEIERGTPEIRFAQDHGKQDVLHVVLPILGLTKPDGWLNMVRDL